MKMVPTTLEELQEVLDTEGLTAIITSTRMEMPRPMQFQVYPLETVCIPAVERMTMEISLTLIHNPSAPIRESVIKTNDPIDDLASDYDRAMNLIKEKFCGTE